MSTILFDQLKLSREIQSAVSDMGFEKATRIQADVIPVLLSGGDVVAQSETGSGKTVAFAVPMVERVSSKLRTVQGLVLCPTRELAIQVAGEYTRLLRHKKGLAVLPVYGGQPIERQIEMLKRGVHIVIGTPGRVLDHLQRGTLSLDAVKMAVLDEADEMLDMGFRDDIQKILGAITSKPQMAFFSATLPNDIRDMIARYMTNPRTIKIEGTTLTVSTIAQFYFDIEYRLKADLVCRLIDIHNIQRGLVFCNQKWVVDEMVLQLQAHGYAAEGLHGDLRQQVRDRVMHSFRSGAVKILVATDVAARGIDVDDIDAVINYDLPQDEEDYVHRIGRTGRAGKKGTAFSLVCGREIYKLRSIERFAGIRIQRRPPPTIEDAQEQRESRMFEKIRGVMAEGHLTHFAGLVERICGDNHQPLDVAAALLKMHMAGKKTQLSLVAHRDRLPLTTDSRRHADSRFLHTKSATGHPPREARRGEARHWQKPFGSGKRSGGHR